MVSDAAFPVKEESTNAVRIPLTAVVEVLQIHQTP